MGVELPVPKMPPKCPILATNFLATNFSLPEKILFLGLHDFANFIYGVPIHKMA
jgi:hypothetical protein